MKILNIAPNRNFKGVNVSYDTTSNIDFMAKKLEPCEEALYKLSCDYYQDVQCEIFESKQENKKGLCVTLAPYDDCFRVPSNTRFVEMFYPYENFDCKKFFEDVKKAVEEMYEFVMNN